MGYRFWLALPLSALLGALVGFLIGLPTLRTRGSYFAISTLCFGVIVSIVAGNWIELTGGYNGVVGIALPTPLSIPWIGRIGFETMAAQYYLVLAFLLFTLLVMHRLVYSLVGLGFMAIRNNEILAEAVGINTFSVKVLSFVVSNFFAAMAGGLYASLIGSISPRTASIEPDLQLAGIPPLGRSGYPGRAHYRCICHPGAYGEPTISGRIPSHYLWGTIDRGDHLLSAGDHGSDQ